MALYLAYNSTTDIYNFSWSFDLIKALQTTITENPKSDNIKHWALNNHSVEINIRKNQNRGHVPLMHETKHNFHSSLSTLIRHFAISVQIDALNVPIYTHKRWWHVFWNDWSLTRRTENSGFQTTRHSSSGRKQTHWTSFPPGSPWGEAQSVAFSIAAFVFQNW